MLGQALAEVVGDKAGMVRYGAATIPMDEALVLCALDFSGRGGLYADFQFTDYRIGTFATELVEEFSGPSPRMPESRCTCARSPGATPTISPRRHSRRSGARSMRPRALIRVSAAYPPPREFCEMSIAIIDYGVGNLRSVQKAFAAGGTTPR